MKLTQFGTDIKQRSQGKWFPFGEIELKIAGTRSKENKEAMRKFYEEKKNDEKNITEITALHCLKGWKNIQDDDGKDIPFSKKAIKELFLKKVDGEFVYESILDFIFDTAINIENYKIELREKKIKN